jgi:hypothetical protein
MVDADRVIGPAPGDGFRQAMDCLEVGRIAVAAAAVGVGRAALWTAVRRSKRRETFGQPISRFQNVSTALGRTAIQLKAARSLTLQAAADKAAGGRHDAVTSAAKVFSAETAVAAALTAIELHGGDGYLTDSDSDPERFLRDATLHLAGEGSNSLFVCSWRCGVTSPIEGHVRAIGWPSMRSASFLAVCLQGTWAGAPSLMRAPGGFEMRRRSGVSRPVAELGTE